MARRRVQDRPLRPHGVAACSAPSSTPGTRSSKRSAPGAWGRSTACATATTRGARSRSSCSRRKTAPPAPHPPGAAAYDAYLASCIDLVVPILDALDYVHRSGLVHRDLKPHNVILTPERKPKIMDFGLAMDVDATVTITRTGTLMGTVAYMSPEQAQGRRIDHRSDLYSVGVVLYELVTGERPFSHNNPLTLVRKHITERPLPPSKLAPGLPDHVERLILRLLEKNPVDRFQTAAEVAQALQRRTIDDAHISTTTFTAPHEKRVFLRSKFVGRKAELERLDRLLDAVLKCKGRFAVLCGEAGVGKTRLVEELKAGAFLEGFRYLVGNCYEKEGIFYQPFVEILREYNRTIGQYDVEWEAKMIGPLGREIARLVPEMNDRETVRKLPEPIVFGEREDKLRLFDAVTRFFLNISRQEPLLFLLDDLHWADELTCEMLHYFVRNTKKERILVVVNYRTEEVLQRGRRHHPLEELLAGMAREGLTEERVQLGRLDNDQTAEMLASLLGDHRVPWQLVTVVVEKTGGNPFMIEEMLKTMVESGAVILRDDGVALRDLEQVDVPTSVRDLIDRRLSRLGDPGRDILAVAAAIGHQFAFDLLRAVTFLAEEEVLDALDEMLRLKLIGEVDARTGDVYEFTHPMTREVLYKSINRRKRRRLHERIAAAIETNFAHELEAHIEELVQHWGAAGDDEKVLVCSLAAARKAFRAYANDQAIHYYEKAFELLKGQESREGIKRRLECLGELLDVLDRKGRWEEGLWRIDEFAELAKSLDEPQAEAEAQRRRGYFLHRSGKVQEAMAQYNQALERLGPDRESPEALKLLHEIARLYYWTNELEIADRMTQRAMTLAERLKDTKEIAYLHNLFASIHQSQGQVRSALAEFQRAHELFERQGEVRGLLYCLNNLGGAWDSLGELEKGCEFKKKGLDLALAVGDVSFAAWMHMSLATTLIRQSKWGMADEHLERAAGLAAQIGDRRSGVRVDLQKARLLYARGRFQEASALLASTRDAAQGMEDFAIVLDAVLHLANLHRRSGRAEQAIPLAEEARKIATSQGRPGSVADAHGTLAECYRDLGRLADAEAQIAKAETIVAKGDQRLAVM
ncbi:MAG: AAA family ATPase, partial [Planctomycetes bacterium]|nr:AAA family ATPase [Planctomycetota bacterium]